MVILPRRRQQIFSPTSVAIAPSIAMLVLASGCLGQGDGTGALDGTGFATTGCDTDAPPATSGGDHGNLFNVGADSSGSGDDAGDGVLPQQPGGDPVQWEYHSASGIYYRRTTEDERDVNGWRDGSLLTVDPTFLSDVLSGESTPRLAVPHALTQSQRPTHVLTVESITLELMHSDSWAPVATFSGGATGSPTTTVTRPTFFSYFALDATASDPAPDDALVYLVAEEDGGFYGVVGLDDRRVRVRGPFVEEADVTYLEIDPPSGNEVILVETSVLDSGWFFAQVPPRPATLTAGEQAAAAREPYGLLSPSGGTRSSNDGRALQCADGLDNDPDGKADNCDYDCLAHSDYGGDNYNHVRAFEYTKNTAVLSDISLCTCAPIGCPAALKWVGEYAGGLLNALDPPEASGDDDYDLDHRAPPLRVRLVRPFIHEGGCAAAFACDANTNGSGCPAGYPFATAGGDLDTLRAEAWNAVDAAAGAVEASTEDLHPISLVGVVASLANNAGSDVGAGGYDPLIAFQKLGAGAIAFDLVDDELGFNGIHLAHEWGHCFGLRHDMATGVPPGASVSTSSFMNSEPGGAPILGGGMYGDEFIEGVSNWEIWATRPWSPFFPRAAGFLHTGCSSNSDCQTPEFPSLKCAGTSPNTFCAEP